MKRDDLPTWFRQELDGERRKLCRDVGQTYDALFDHGYDPREEGMVAEVTEVLNKHVVIALARQTERREAA